MGDGGKDAGGGDLFPEGRVWKGKSRLWRWGKRIAIALFVLAALLVAGGSWFIHSADSRLQAQKALIQSRGEPASWQDLRRPHVPDEKNAVFLYRQAALSPVPSWNSSDRKRSRSPGENEKLERLESMLPYLLDNPGFRREHEADMRKILQLSADALTICRQATALTDVDWDFPDPNVHATEQKWVVTSYRILIRILCLAALEAQAEGDDAAAVEYLGDARALGRAVEMIPSLVHHSLREGMEGNVYRVIEQIAPTLQIGAGQGQADPRRVRELMTGLLDGEEVRRGWVMALIGERCMIQDSIERPIEDWVSRGRGAENSLVVAFFRHDEATYLAYMEQAIQAARAADVFTMRVSMPSTKMGRITRLMSPLTFSLRLSVIGMSEGQYVTLAEMREAATALAVRLFPVANGRPPESLADLVPEYLPAVPGDPFGKDAKPLRYLPKATPPVLYSIGGDGKDDGGRNSEHLGEPDDIVFFLNGDHPVRMTDWKDPTIKQRMPPGMRAASMPGAATAPLAP